MKVIALIIATILAIPAQAQNWTAGKVTWAFPLVAWDTGIIQYHAGISNGKLTTVHEDFIFTFDAHNDQPNYGTYVAHWAASTGPTYTRVYQPNGTWVVQVTGPLNGTFTTPDGQVTAGVPGWFSDTITDTQYGNNTAWACGDVSVFLAPNGKNRRNK